MTGKRQRQAAIREILVKNSGSTQEKIIEHLENQGITASQATLSRDLREMGAVKIPVNGGAVYKLGGQYNLDEIGSAMKAFSVRHEAVGNFLVIQTAPGNAQGLCVILDRQSWTEIVGTIAGDDTILVIARTASDIGTLENYLKESIGKDNQ